MPPERDVRERRHVYVSGLVQGVGYRWFCQRTAEIAGLAGWVRNLPDGRVELEIEGSRSRLERFLADLRAGPPGARVADLQIEPLEVSGDPGFTIRFDI